MWTVLFADKCGSSAAPKPIAKPAPRPAPRATPRPTVRSTPKPAAKPVPTPAALGTPAPDLEFDSSPEVVAVDDAQPVDDGPDQPAAVVPPGLRVADPVAPSGLFETIVGGVAGRFFGS